MTAWEEGRTGCVLLRRVLSALLLILNWRVVEEQERSRNEGEKTKTCHFKSESKSRWSLAWLAKKLTTQTQSESDVWCVYHTFFFTSSLTLLVVVVQPLSDMTRRRDGFSCLFLDSNQKRQKPENKKTCQDSSRHSLVRQIDKSSRHFLLLQVLH